jgi:hypothetical protein
MTNPDIPAEHGVAPGPTRSAPGSPSLFGALPYTVAVIVATVAIAAGVFAFLGGADIQPSGAVAGAEHSARVEALEADRLRAEETAQWQAEFTARLGATAASADASFQVNETNRMQSLQPTDDPRRTLWVSRHR